MATIITRETGTTAKGAPLTNTEVDNNFININTEVQDHKEASNPHNITPATINAEPAFEKASAFNKPFGSDAETVAEGNDFRFPVQQSIDPTIDYNPPSIGAKELNTTTGEEWVCIDNTLNNNVWVGNLGGFVSPSLDSLVIEYDFIQGINGTTVVDSTGVNDGTIYGAIPTLCGIKFDGVDDYIDTPVISLPSPAWTMLFSGSVFDVSSIRAIAGMDADSETSTSPLLDLQIEDGSGSISFNIMENPATVANVGRGFPFMIAMRYTGTNHQILSYGRQIANDIGVYNSELSSANGSLKLGAGYIDGVLSNFFNGVFRAFALYSSALTDYEIKLLGNRM
jgi:hypothetical protein